MKHLRPISKTCPAVAASSLEIKLTSKIEIIDRLLLAQRQAAWKVPYPTGGGITTDTTGTTTTGT